MEKRLFPKLARVRSSMTVNFIWAWLVIRPSRLLDGHAVQSNIFAAVLQSGINCRRDAGKLKTFRLRHQRGDLRQQFPSGAAVDDAVIEAQCQRGFGYGQEILDFIIPARRFSSCAQTE